MRPRARVAVAFGCWMTGLFILYTSIEVARGGSPREAAWTTAPMWLVHGPLIFVMLALGLLTVHHLLTAMHDIPEKRIAKERRVAPIEEGDA